MVNLWSKNIKDIEEVRRGKLVIENLSLMSKLLLIMLRDATWLLMKKRK